VNKKHLLLPVLAAALGVGSLASTLAAATDPAGKTAATTPAPRIARHVEAKLTRRLRAATWHWETVMGVRRSRSSAPLNTRVALRFWRRHAASARRLAASPPNKRGWLCIHGFEGAWADSGDPYWGGLQMDRGFMSRYAPRLLLRRGWANRWTPLEQMWVAERARRSGRGYWPWPNAARICGLL
jgi:hypothetical protein